MGYELPAVACRRIPILAVLTSRRPTVVDW